MADCMAVFLIRADSHVYDVWNHIRGSHSLQRCVCKYCHFAQLKFSIWCLSHPTALVLWILICLGMLKLPVGWHVRYSILLQVFDSVESPLQTTLKIKRKVSYKRGCPWPGGFIYKKLWRERFQKKKKRKEKNVVLKKEWSLTRVVSREGSLSVSLGQSFTRAVSH